DGTVGARGDDSMAPAPDQAAATQEAVFRINRASASSGELTVEYVLTACSSTGAVSRQREAVVLGEGCAYADILPVFEASQQGGRPEIVTLRLACNGTCAAGEPAATYFVAGSAGAC